MPTRLIREGILTSKRVNGLSWEQECFYRRLLSIVDDYGRCEAHASLLRASLYPLKLGRVREAGIERMLTVCQDAGLLRIYEVNTKRYLEIFNFKQATRSPSKCPPPPVAKHPLTDAKHLKTEAEQPKANVHLGVSVSVSEGEGVSEGGPAALTVFKPPTLQEWQTQAHSIDPDWPAGDVESSFNHYQACGWKMGSGRGKRIVDWQACCATCHGLWKRPRPRVRGLKKSAGEGAAIVKGDFNPKQPHAHTGGVAPEN